MKEKKFRAMVVTESEEGAFSRKITTKTVGELPEGDVLIRVGYSSLNYKDALSATGNKGVTKRYPHTPGVDAAGVVEESLSDRFQPGEEVIVTGFDLGMNTSGGYGEYIRVPADWVVKRPDTLSLRESMIYGTAGFTGALSVFKLTRNGVKPDQGDVLVTGAPGGVGSIALSILVKSGFQVVAVNGLVDARDYLMDLGAKDVISIEEAVDTSGRPLIKGRWAGVIDTVGGEILATALKSVQYSGTVTCCGNVGSPEFSTTVYPFILRGVSLLGIDSVNCPWEIRTRIWEKLSAEWKLDYLDRIAAEISLEDLDERIDMILAGTHRGRAVVNLMK
ncbi:MAG: YhdH/YhfP family quinone oxidoreductase [Desulfomonilaceae bacterium]|nr:YhdH/YhfP family quinone oxidoreductase [Desulfomonilaceae bacterium]